MGHRADTPPSTYESVDGLIVIERPIERALHFRFTEDDARTVDRIAQLTGLSIRAENRAARSQRQLGLRLGPGDWLVVSGGNDDHGLEELSGDEAAAALGVTPGHVAVLLHRARKQLERCMSESAA